MNEETPPVDSRAIPSMRIFVFCDGTAQNAVRNKEVTEDTNVQRFKQCVPVSGSVHHIYESGIGTHAPENAGMLSLSSLGNISCQVTGSDMHDVIHRLYYKLCEEYQSNPGAEIHLIGFSRGAFAVRCLACLIEDIGLLKSPFLTKNYTHIYDNWKSQNDDAAAKFHSWITKKRHKQALWPVRIASCGVWDTVSALIPSSTLSFVNDRVPENLGFAFQALGLHERRHTYNPLLWQEESDSETSIRQCWFAGDHSDIGGSWSDCGLANLTLVWMLAQYERCFTGMPIDCERLSKRLCPPGTGFPYLSHTLSQGNVNHCSFPPAPLFDGVRARERLLRHHEDDDDPLLQRQTIHFTVRLFLARHRKEVTERACLLTAGTCKLLEYEDCSFSDWLRYKLNHSDQPGMTWLLKGYLIIMEDETTEWENKIINTWTKRAHKLVKREVDNIFERGIRVHGMTIGHLVRGYESSGKIHNLVSLIANQRLRKPEVSTDEQARKLIIERAWDCSLEHFLRANRNQGICKASDKFCYFGNITTEDTFGNCKGNEEGDEKGRKQSIATSQDATSYTSQDVYSTVS